MANNLEFILKLKDLLSPAMESAATLTEKEATKIANQVRAIGVSAEKANTGVSALKRGLGMLASVAGPFIGSFYGFEFLKRSTEKFNEAAQAQAQLRASLLSTKGAANLNTEALDAQAEALQKTTLYEKDATTHLQSILLTFTNIKGAIFTQAVPAIQDMSTKLGFDLKDAAIQVGKALNDPIKGITALRRVGVAFSDSQQKFIKHLVETNHTAEAQTLILKELNTEFGGSAAAAAKAGTGPFTQLANRMNEVREKIGEVIVKLGMGLMPLLNGFVNILDRTVGAIKGVYHWFQRNEDAVIKLTLILGGLWLAFQIGRLTFAAYVLWSQRAVIWSGIKAAYFAIETAVLTGLGTAVEFVNAMFLASPVGWIVLGVIALVAIIGYLIYAFDGWGKTWKNLMDFQKYSWAAFKDTFQIIWLNIQDAFMTGIELIEKGWYRLKSLWDKDGAAAGLSKINDQQNSRAEAIAKANGLLMSDLQKAEASAKWEVHSNGKTLGSIIGDLKKKMGINTGVNPATANGGFGASGKLAGDIGDGKDKSDSINRGGQRSIVINIAKQIERLEVHVMDAKEGADEIESAVRDAMRRVVYSMNGVAS